MSRPNFWGASRLVVSGALRWLAVVGIAVSTADARQTTASVRQPLVDDYRVGPQDLLEIKVFEAPELDRLVRVSEAGEISVPLMGSVAAADSTLSELEERLAHLLRSNHFVKDPHVTVVVREVQSHPISVLGAVSQPGVLQVRGEKPLLEILSLAGGLTEDAGERVIVMRGNAPAALPKETADGPDSEPGSLVVDLKLLLETGDASLNVPVRPGDTVKVIRAGIIYVVGEVRKPGGYVLKNNETLSVLQALAVAEGLTPTAAKKDSVIIRQTADGARSEIPVDLEKVLRRKATDPYLRANDIVFIPTSGAKAAFLRTLDAVVRTVSGIAIYRR